MHILYEDNHLLVVDKPVGMSTMGTTEGPTVYRWAGEYLKQKYHKPGNVFVGIVSRLDTFTSGVLVLARTSKAASRLSQQFREARTAKTYLALLEGTLTPGEHHWTDWVRKDDAAHRMRCVAAQSEASQSSGSQQAKLQLEVLRSWSQRTLVKIQLETGRKHQIRVQASSRGHAVWGDRKYGASSRLKAGIALHSYSLQFTHPTRHEVLTFRSGPPAAWKQLGLLNNDLPK